MDIEMCVCVYNLLINFLFKKCMVFYKKIYNTCLEKDFGMNYAYRNENQHVSFVIDMKTQRSSVWVKATKQNKRKKEEHSIGAHARSRGSNSRGEKSSPPALAFLLFVGAYICKRGHSRTRLPPCMYTCQWKMNAAVSRRIVVYSRALGLARQEIANNDRVNRGEKCELQRQNHDTDENMKKKTQLKKESEKFILVDLFIFIFLIYPTFFIFSHFVETAK